MKYAWIREHHKAFSVAILCDVLEVCSSGYYAWLHRKPAVGTSRTQQMLQAVTVSYLQSHRVYGYRKVYKDLRELSIAGCSETVRRVMKRLGFSAQIKRNYVVTTDSDHSFAVADNLLDRDFTATAPNQKWVADITYIPTQEGWLFLAAVLDLFGRRIVGWAMSQWINEALVSSALQMALQHRRPQPGLLHHSDRGSQYASDGYQDILDQVGMVCSMSRKGNCWDNAVMERFFGSLKREWIKDKIYRTREDAKKDLFKYIEWFYNTQRRHAALDYQTPAAVEELYRREHQIA
ncbi:MAG: IS3 family transposase [Phycisphaerales bacterium]